MKRTEMTSFERVSAAVSHTEPDRVPLFLMLSIYGCKEMQATPREFFRSPQNVVDAQLRMREKYKNDCLSSFFYAALEIEAFGGEVVFSDDGPPTTGEPFLKSEDDIKNMELPDIKTNRHLGKVLEATALLRERAGNEVPVLGTVISPFSLPVMQLGFQKYLELLYFNREAFNLLMRKNICFCAAWANALYGAGATDIGYSNPLASPAMIEKSTYLSTGYDVDRRTLAMINAPVAMHLGSGVTLPVIEELIATGVKALGFSASDDVAALKRAANGRICLLGNLNAIDMMNWDTVRVGSEIKKLLQAAGPGGGFILSDNHGEIPLQVPEDTLLEITEAVQRDGRYPLEMACDG